MARRATQPERPARTYPGDAGREGSDRAGDCAPAPGRAAPDPANPLRADPSRAKAVKRRSRTPGAMPAPVSSTPTGTRPVGAPPLQDTVMLPPSTLYFTAFDSRLRNTC